jgi:hypothetical protein
VEDIYMRAIKHRHTGYAARSTLTLLAHLFDTYGRITAHDLEENEKRFRNTWSPTQPFEELIGQVEDAVDYAEAGGSPYSTAQIVTNAYNIVFKTGAFPEACREWRRRPHIDKTWANFTTDFTTAHNDYREMQTTTAGGSGYQQSAHMVMEEFVHNTTLEFANLAAATASDREVMQQLTKTNADLTNQLAAQLVEMKQLQQQLLRHNENQDGGGGGGRDRDRDRRPPRRDREPAKKRHANMNYCWSHGYDCATGHNSATCSQKKDGHKTDATRENNMGGCNWNKNKIP